MDAQTERQLTYSTSAINYETLLAAVVATICLSALSCHAFESKQAIASSDMQPYVFTYNFNKQVDPVAKQYNATRQTLDHVLALDIQDQVYPP